MRFVEGCRYLATHDFLADYNRYLPWRHPLGVTAAAVAASILCGVYVHGNAWIVAAVFATVAVLAIVWPAISVAFVRVSIRFAERRVREGERVRLIVELRNFLPLPLYGLTIEGHWNRASDDVSQSLGAVNLGHWSKQVVVMYWTPTSRGVYPLSPPRIACGFPFGFWNASRLVSLDQPLLVWPKTVPVQELPESKGEMAVRDDNLLQRSGTFGDMFGVRQYRRGDPLKRIHWGQSAKHNSLIVCEQHASSVPSLHILLDVSSDSHQDMTDNGTREWAIRLAASLARVGWNRGANVEILFNETWIGGVSSGVLDALAKINDQTGADLATLIRQTNNQKHSGCEFIVVTTSRGVSKAKSCTGGRSLRFVVVDSETCEEMGEKAAATLSIRPWWKTTTERLAGPLNGVRHAV